MIRKIHILCLFFLLALFIGTVSANEDSNLTETVSKSDMHLETQDVEMFYKDGTSFNVKVVDNNSAIAGEKINFTVNGVTYSRKINSLGESKLNINLAPGEYEIKADSILNSQKLSVINTIKIKEMNSTLIGDKIVELGYREGKYSVTLIGGYNKPLIGKDIIFTVNGVEYSRKTNDVGVASLSINLNPNTYTISAKFSELFHKFSSISSALNVDLYGTRFLSNNSQFNNSNVEYSVKLIYNGKHPVKNHLVLFSLQDSSTFVKTDENGIATFKKVLNPGIYSISFEFLGSTGYFRSLGGNTFEVLHNNESSADDFESRVKLETKDIQMFYKDGTSFKIRVFENGQEVEGKKINITINGVTYSRTSNSQGEAKLALNLPPGEYEIETSTILDNQRFSTINKIIINQMNSTLVGEEIVELGYKQGKYAVTLLGGYNKPLIGKTVVFSVNGVEYLRNTKDDGVASLAINLSPGSYPISAKFQDSFHTQTEISSIVNIGIFATKFLSNYTKFSKPTVEYQVKLVDEKNRSVKDVYVAFCLNNNMVKIDKTNDEGIATFKDVLKAGFYNISFSYVGSSGYLKSSGSNTFEVGYADIIIQAKDFETCVDGPLYYLVSLNDSNNSKLINETVKLDIYQEEKYVKTIESKTLEDGVARFTFDLNPGKYKVKNYLSDDGSCTYNNVTIKSASIIVSSSNLILNRKGEYYTLTLRNNETNMAIANKIVTITVNGVDYKRTTDINGVARLKINLADGEYKIRYFINENGKYGNVEGSNLITLTDKVLASNIYFTNTEIIRKGTYCTVKLTDVNGIGLRQKEVLITVNGVSYKRITNDDGLAKLKINLKDGNYALRADFAGDSLFLYSIRNDNLEVNTNPTFNYTLNISGFINYKNFTCPFMREFTIKYNNIEYNLDYCCERNCPKITQHNSYFISDNGIESNYNVKQGIEFKYDGGNILIIFYGRSSDVGQFNVIFSYENELYKIDYVLDNEVIATIHIQSYYAYDDYNTLNTLGYSFFTPDNANSSFKYGGHEFTRVVKLDSSKSLSNLKNHPKFETFDTIQSYLLTSKKITSKIMEEKISNAFNFSGNYEKYAYELYLASLMTMWSADSSADISANKLNITWDKRNQVILTNIDWTQLSLDAYVPINVYGNETNCKLFKLNYGLLFSLCEEFGLQSTGNNATSAVNKIFSGIYGGNDFIVDKKGDFLTIKLVNASDKFTINMKNGDASAYTYLDIDYFLSNLAFKGSVSQNPTSIKPNVEFSFGYFKNRFTQDVSGFLNALNFFSIRPEIMLKDSVSASISAASIAIAIKTGTASLPILLFQIGINVQQYTLDYRNKYAPESTWQYYASHGSVGDVKTIAIVNNETHYTDYVEIPYDGRDNLDFEKGRYIDSVTGKRNLTQMEKDKYAAYS